MTVMRSTERPWRALPRVDADRDSSLTASLTALLDVITTEAPPGALDEILGRLRVVTGALGADPWTLDRAANRALQAVRAHRRSEQTLLALHETVTELGALREPGALFDGIVRLLVRLLPGTDVAWLAAPEVAGDRRPRAAWGLVTPGPALPLDPSGGLGSLVRRTGSPVAVESYLECPDFAHDPDLDAHARAEGIVCVLAVPLAGAVLYAARRSARPFAPDEISLAHRFAAAAAVPLAAALALADSERLRDRLTERLRLRDDSAAMVDALLRMVSAADLPTLPAAATVLEQGLAATVTLLDAHDHVIHATAGRPAPTGPARDAIRQARREPGRMVTGTAPDGAVLYAAVCDGRAGVLLVRRETVLAGDCLRDLHRAVQLLAVIGARQEAVLRAHTEVRAELLTELLGTHRPLPPSTRALVEARRLRLDREHVVVAVGSPAPATAIADIAQNLGGVGGRHAGTLVAVVPASDPRAVAGEISARLTRIGVRAPVCAADPVDPAGGALADAFDTARHGLVLLKALGQPDLTATARELALYRLLFDADRADDLRAFLDGVLRPLLDYDRQHRTDLVTTVRVFLGAGGNATQAARELFIHLNTMAKRLERVARLLGDDWQSGPDNLRLRLALHLHSLSAPA